MKTALFIVSLFSIAYAASVSNRIVGGETAKKGQFPHEVSLRANRNHKCGGSILNEEWILTAAHCVAGKDISNYNIIAGTNTISDTYINHNVSFTIHHPNYTVNADTVSYDIALVKLQTPLSFNDLVQSIPLVTSPVPPGSLLTLSGWGVPHPDIPHPVLQLKYLEVTAMDLEECGERFQELGYEMDETMFCGEQEYGEGACMGDSGSPLVYEGRVAGLASWVEPCGIGYPDVYTNVLMFVDWVEEQMRKN